MLQRQQSVMQKPIMSNSRSKRTERAIESNIGSEHERSPLFKDSIAWNQWKVWNFSLHFVICFEGTGRQLYIFNIAASNPIASHSSLSGNLNSVQNSACESAAQKCAWHHKTLSLEWFELLWVFFPGRTAEANGQRRGHMESENKGTKVLRYKGLKRQWLTLVNVWCSVVELKYGFIVGTGPVPLKVAARSVEYPILHTSDEPRIQVLCSVLAESVAASKKFARWGRAMFSQVIWVIHFKGITESTSLC